MPVQRLARYLHHLFPQTLSLRGSVIHPQQVFPPRIDLHDPLPQPTKEKAVLYRFKNLGKLGVARGQLFEKTLLLQLCEDQGGDLFQIVQKLLRPLGDRFFLPRREGGQYDYPLHPVAAGNRVQDDGILRVLFEQLRLQPGFTRLQHNHRLPGLLHHCGIGALPMLPVNIAVGACSRHALHRLGIDDRKFQIQNCRKGVGYIIQEWLQINQIHEWPSSSFCSSFSFSSFSTARFCFSASSRRIFSKRK